MLGLCEAKNGTQIDELLQAGASGHKRTRQDAKTNSDSRRQQETGRLKDKRGELLERNTEDCRLSLRCEDSWRGKGLWNLAREKMLQDRGALPKEEGDIVREYKAMHEVC